MSDIAIKFENISKQYRLGTIGTGTLSHDLNRWWAMNIRGKDDPNLKIGQVNDRATKSTEDYVWALRDIDFEVKQGEVLGIIGKNGAGKSTLLKILSRVTTPTTGRITAYGRIASLLEVGTGFHPEMTGRENIYMNGTIMGMRRWEIDKKLDEIVDFAGVEKYMDTPVKRYSSGMTVRLGFAIAAHLEPEILVVDEVLAVGDAEFQKKAIGKMKDVSRNDGRTVLFVSHNMAAIQNLCPKAILLEDGIVTCIGKTEEVMNTYLNFEMSNFENTNHISTHIIAKFEMIDNNDFKCKNIFKCGTNITFVVNVIPKRKLKNIDFTFAIFNVQGQRVLTFDTRYQIKESYTIIKPSKHIIKWEKNCLTPGLYEVRASYYENNIFLAGWEKVYFFNIIESDYYKTGRLPDSGQGNILTDVEWIFNELEGTNI